MRKTTFWIVILTARAAALALFVQMIPLCVTGPFVNAAVFLAFCVSLVCGSEMLEQKI